MPRFSIFYGWWIVAAGMASLLLAGGIGYYAFGAFFTPLEEALQCSRTQLSLAVTMGCLVGLLGPLIGTWVDKYGARRVMALGALITGSAIALLGFTTSIWQLYALFFIMAVGQVGLLNIPVATAVSNWFVEKRGLAMGITLSGFGLGGLLMLPLASYLISTLDWRMAYHILGLLICVCLIPLSIFVMRHKPEERGLLPDGRTSQEGETEIPSTVDSRDNASWTLSSALRTRTFWLIVGALSLAFVGTGAVITHLIPFLQDTGTSHQMASTTLGLAIGVSIFGRIIAGHISDRVPIRYVIMLCFLLQIVGLAILLGVGSIAMVWVFVIVFGLAIGGMFALEPLLVSQYFGLTSFGAIYGGIWALIAVGFAGGPLLAGYIFDATGGYDLAFILFIIATLIAIALVFVLGAPRPRQLDLSLESEIR